MLGNTLGNLFASTFNGDFFVGSANSMLSVSNGLFTNFTVSALPSADFLFTDSGGLVQKGSIGNSTGGSFNFFIAGAGNDTLSGSGNFGEGLFDLGFLTTGSINYGLGLATLGSLTFGSTNTGIGNGVFTGLIDGNNNIGIGYKAGFNLLHGNSNIVIGVANSGKNYTGSELKIFSLKMQDAIGDNVYL